MNRRSQVKVRKLETTHHFALLSPFFKRPLNLILIVIFAAGLLLLTTAYEYHPTVESIYNQNLAYSVSNTTSTNAGFVLFPNETTNIRFIVPENTLVNYSIGALATLKVNPSPENPNGYKQVWVSLCSGNASNGAVLNLKAYELAYPVSTSIQLVSVSGSAFNMSIIASSSYNSTLEFSPFYAILGLAMSTSSVTLLATLAGTKSDEI